MKGGKVKAENDERREVTRGQERRTEGNEEERKGEGMEGKGELNERR